MKGIPVAALAALVLASLTSACAPRTARTEEAGHGAIGTANPASVHCVEKRGGTLELKTDKDGGSYGVCHLPDGTQVDEWELFRNDTADKQD